MNSAPPKEIALTIQGKDALLAAIHHQAVGSSYTVIIVPGRPQTRVGPHRLFVELSRMLLQMNISSIRFDHRGWGDSLGDELEYQDSWHDIQAVSEYILQHSPEQKFILLGLCDGATSIMLALRQHIQADGLILLNPYLENTSAESQAMLKQHYLPRILSASRLISLFNKPLQLPKKLCEFLRHIVQIQHTSDASCSEQAIRYLERSKVPILLILSEDDITAGQASVQLASWISESPENLSLVEAKQADHTFSRAGNKSYLYDEIGVFLKSNFS